MTKTNWSRCSRLLLAVLLVASLSGAAVAVSVGDESVPSDAEVGTQVSGSVTLTQLYQNPQLESWELNGTTDLEQVTWTVVFYDQTGSKIDQQSVSGQNLSGVAVGTDDGVDEVEVRITGTVPEIENYSYDPAQTFLFAELVQTREGGASSSVESWQVDHYTADSREARQALDEAKTAIDEADAAGANVGEAETTFNQAVNAYEDESFDLAVELANEAEGQADSSAKSSQTTRTLLDAGAAVVVLALLVGGFLYWRSTQESYDRLG